VESGKNYKNTRFVSSKRQCVNAASNPRFNRMIPIHDTLAFVMLDRAKRRCARPVAVAQTVLDQAKLVFCVTYTSTFSNSVRPSLLSLVSECV
jgi:ureidoglycolate hydrolase